MKQKRNEEPNIQVEHREGCDVLHIMQGGEELRVPGFPVTLRVPGFPVTQPKFDLSRKAADKSST